MYCRALTGVHRIGGRIEGDLAYAKPGMPQVSMNTLCKLRLRVVSIGGDLWASASWP